MKLVMDKSTMRSLGYEVDVSVADEGSIILEITGDELMGLAALKNEVTVAIDTALGV